MLDPRSAAILAQIRRVLRDDIERVESLNGWYVLEPIGVWIGKAAFYHHGANNNKANWCSFLRAYFPPTYHHEQIISGLYELRGGLHHRGATRHPNAPAGLLASEDEGLVHLAPIEGTRDRWVRPDVYRQHTLEASKKLNERLDTDHTYAQRMAQRNLGIARPITVKTAHGTFGATATSPGDLGIDMDDPPLSLTGD